MLGVLLSGCSPMSNNIPFQVSSGQISTPNLKTPSPFSLEQLTSCVTTPGGVCPPPRAGKIASESPTTLPGAKAAFFKKMAQNLLTIIPSGSSNNSSGALQGANVLSSETLTKLEQLLQQATMTGNATTNVSITPFELAAFGKSIYEATVANAWDELQDLAKQQAQSATDTTQAATANSASRLLSLIKTYLAAYFNIGQLLTIVVDSTDASNSAAIASQLAEQGLSANEAKALASALLPKISLAAKNVNGNFVMVIPKSGGGFVTRGGTTYNFPAPSLSINPTSTGSVQASAVDFTQVGADIIRIVIEAIGDEIAQLPANKASTACLMNTPELKCYGDPKEQVTSAQFAQVNFKADQVEALAGATAGQLIRGASIAALNNEAVAKIVETAVAVIARKTAERVAWCSAACSSSQQ